MKRAMRRYTPGARDDAPAILRAGSTRVFEDFDYSEPREPKPEPAPAEEGWR